MKKIIWLFLLLLSTNIFAETGRGQLLDLLEKRGYSFWGKSLSSIRKLDLTDRPIDDNDLKLLTLLPNLKHLEADGEQITDKGMAFIGGFKKLRVLKLGKTFISDIGLRYLTNLKRLSILEIQDSPITEEGILHLEKIKSLRSLYLPGDIDSKAVRHLEAELPFCKVRKQLLGFIDPKILPFAIIIFIILMTVLAVSIGTSRLGVGLWPKIKRGLGVHRPGVLQLVLAVPITFLFLVLMFSNISLLINGVTTKGEVIQLIRVVSRSKGKTSVTYKPRVKFFTEKKKLVVFVGSVSSSPPAYDVGETITVLYPPDNPRRAIIRNFGGLFGLFVWSLGAGIGAFILIFIGIRKRLRYLRENRENRENR